MQAMMLDRMACFRAIECRDPRFDGRLFIGVRTTGVYCRPICPARTPKLENCTFFSTAAAAQAAGFRPCLRCRPEISPQVAAWRGTSNTVHRALALIADGGLDGEEAGIEVLADRLGMGARQLRRLFKRHLGASPVTVAQTRRILFAKQLIHETELPMAEVALASGFGSVRRFNHTFKQMFGRPPRELRRGKARHQSHAPAVPIVLTLSYAGPFDWDAMLDFLGADTIPGLELVIGGRYHRTIALAEQRGWIEVSRRSRPDFRGDALEAAIRFPDVCMLAAIVARIRRMFDLSADMKAIGAHLSSDAGLAPLIAARPGLRVPGAWDEFELAVRAVLDRHLEAAFARELVRRLVRAHGRPLELDGAPAGLTHVFPRPEALAAAALAPLGMPQALADAINRLARAFVMNPGLFQAGPSLEETLERLRTLPGIDDRTAHYIAMRALRETDAFPAGDLSGAAAWRPWRAYAAMQLWTSRNSRQERPVRERPMRERQDAVVA
jgi:AraC family transcriptional regulator of adaptative response / DNA-3-methyladenine glycosylase II